MLLIATPSRVLLILAAAPPHFSTPVALVRPTAPIEIRLLIEFFHAVDANSLLVRVKPLPICQFRTLLFLDI